MNAEREGSGRLALGLIGVALAFACCAGPLLFATLLSAGFFASVNGNDIVAGAFLVVAIAAAGLWFSRRRLSAACCEPYSNGKLQLHE